MSDTKVQTEVQNSTIAVYDSSHDALVAVKQLKEAGFSKDVVSVIGKGIKETDEIHGWVPEGSKAGSYGAWGALWGAITGWLLVGFVWLPGIGWVAAAGWLASALVGAGLGAGLGALTGLAVPNDEVAEYENELKADRYLVIVHGDKDSVHRAQAVLEEAKSLRVSTYHA